MSSERTFQEGLILLNEQKYQDAFAKFTTVIKENPKQVEAYVGLGLCLEKMGQLPEAAQNYKAALKIEPHNVMATYNLGVVYLGLNKNIRAWWQFKKTLKLEPKNSQALHNIGLIHFNHKRYNWAISYLIKAAEIPNEKIHTIYYLLAKAYQVKDQEKEVLFYLQKSIQHRPDFLPSLLELLKLYQKRNEWLKFFEIVKKIYKLCPENRVLQTEILSSLQTIKEKKLNLNGLDSQKLDTLITEFETQLKPPEKPASRSRIRDLYPRVIITEPDESSPRVYH